MSILIGLILGVLVVDAICGAETPDDIKMYYAEDWDTPFIGGILVYIKWKQIL